MKKVAESHLDHGLTDEQVNFLLEKFADRSEFFIETIELPEELGTVPCGIYGPSMGDVAVSEDQVHYAARNDRPYPSRLIDREPRQVRQVSVIAGPHEEDGEKIACALYTAFGGPVAPQEPGDPTCQDLDASKIFWSEHALSA